MIILAEGPGWAGACESETLDVKDETCQNILNETPMQHSWLHSFKVELILVFDIIINTDYRHTSQDLMDCNNFPSNSLQNFPWLAFMSM